MAMLIKADGSEVLQPITHPLTLEAMQALVGGSIEFVTIGGTPERRAVLIVDEEGLLKGKPLNIRATFLYRTRGTPSPLHSAVLVGDVIYAVVTHMGLESETYQ